jgi:trigger factor
LRDEIASKKDAIVSEFCATANLPGFRKGKVPKGIILSKFSSDIDARVKSVLVNEAFENIQRSADELNLLTVVDYSTEDLEDGFVCKLAFDLRPNVGLPDYENIALTAFSDEVTAGEVNSELDHIKKQHSSYNLVERDVKAGDYVKVSYDGVLEDGVAIVDAVPNHKIYGKQTNTWEEAGNAEIYGVQAVIQGVIGRKTGDKDEGEEVFPEDFSIPELAGKKAIYTFEILEVRERIDPELNEEFFKQYGVDSIDGLRERIGEHLARRKRTQGLLKQRDEIVHFLADSAKFELPGSVVDKELQSLVQAFIDGQVRKGIPAKYFEVYVDEISKNLLPVAEIRTKAGMVLDKIAEAEKTEIDNKDIEAMIIQDVTIKKIKVDQYVRDLKNDRDKLVDLRTRTLRGKVLDFLIKTNSKETAEIEKTPETTRGQEEESE